MSEQASTVNKPQPSGSMAALKNVIGAMELTRKLQKRGAHQSNIGCMFARSGEGKSYATIYVQNKTNAVRVEVGESWDRRMLVQAILQECGAPNPKGRAAAMVVQAVELLGDDPDRPLIIDEADKLVDNGLIEIIREIADKSQVPVLLVGEELLPTKLARYERVHNRVLAWYPASPCDHADVRKLADMFVKVPVDDALIEKVRLTVDGRARRIVNNLSAMDEWARTSGVKELTLESYRGEIVTGEPPQPRGRRTLLGTRGRAA